MSESSQFGGNKTISKAKEDPIHLTVSSKFRSKWAKLGFILRGDLLAPGITADLFVHDSFRTFHPFFTKL